MNLLAKIMMNDWQRFIDIDWALGTVLEFKINFNYHVLKWLMPGVNWQITWSYTSVTIAGYPAELNFQGNRSMTSVRSVFLDIIWYQTSTMVPLKYVFVA